MKAENELNITSGTDTNIIGSKASGEKVTADIGGNLNIESLQDKETQKWDKSSWGASGSIGLSGNIAGKGGFNFNAGTNKMESDYESVSEQAGIYAGSRGFDIYTEGNTDLKGGIIDSKATADKNNLDTGTLTFNDIDNKAEYDTKGYGFSYSGLTNEEKKQGNRPVMQGDKGFIPAIPMASGDEEESTTHSAIAEGTITIRNKEQQKQNVENLRRETKNTLNKLDKIFDKEKIEEKQELAGQFSELSFNAIHNLSKNWSEEQKVLAHSAVGYISGELANSKNSFSTALTAGVNKFVTEEILKDEKTRLHYKEHPEELQWLSAALGAAIGQMVGGDATSGASIAASGTKNNRLNEEEFEQYKKELAEAKSTAEIMAIFEKYKDIDVGHEKELQEALKDQDFYDGLAQALKENPDLKEYQGVIINGKSIQTAYSGEKTLSVRYGGFDENGNYILKDNKVAIDARDKDMQKGIGMALVTGGVGIAADAGVVGAGAIGSALDWLNIELPFYKSLIEENTKNDYIDFAGSRISKVIGKKLSTNAKMIVDVVNTLITSSLKNYDGTVMRSQKLQKEGK